MTGIVPTYDTDAEKACLGAVLLNNDALAEVRAILGGAGDFYSTANQRIFLAMTELADKGGVVDHVTLGERLRSNGDLEIVGGVSALSVLADSVATIANVGHYARIVRDKAQRRRMISVAQNVVAQGYAGESEIVDFLASSRKAITLASAYGTSDGPQLVETGMGQLFRELETGSPPEGIVHTGIGAIDGLIGGLYPGLMTVIGGRPGMGKSALVLNIAANAAKQGKKVMYITLEDDRRFVLLRLLARFADVDLNNLMLRTVPRESWTDLAQAAITISALGLFVEDSPGLTSDRIQQIAALHHQLHGLDLLIIDHLGEVADKGENQTAVIEAAAKALRDIAKELNIPVLLAVQLNREVERRADKRPTLHDLRQSGAIEQIARFVWFTYRRGYYAQGCEEDPDTQLIIAKSSHGKTGTIRLWSDLSRMYFRGWDLDTDGVFPAENSGKYEKPYSSGEPDRRQKGFFDNTGPNSTTANSKSRYGEDY